MGSATQLHVLHCSSAAPPLTRAFCAHAGVPKVALLFLVRGQIPHHQLWDEWLQDAEGRVTAADAARLGCSPVHREFVRQACLGGGGGGGGGAGGRQQAQQQQQQQLYSIYVHPTFLNATERYTGAFAGRQVRWRWRARSSPAHSERGV